MDWFVVPVWYCDKIPTNQWLDKVCFLFTKVNLFEFIDIMIVDLILSGIFYDITFKLGWMNYSGVNWLMENLAIFWIF